MHPKQPETNAQPVTSPEEMGWQLIARKWRQKSKHLWVSPKGKYFIGVRDAWAEMKKRDANGT